MKSFYNTTKESKETVKLFEKKAKTQNDIVLDYFKAHSEISFSPETIWMRCFKDQRVPITSVRRSISNLTKRGLLIKTKEKKLSSFGRPAYKWTFNNNKGMV